MTAKERPEWLEEAIEAYEDASVGGKFVFWWLSSMALLILTAILVLSVVWTPWIGIVALIILVILITIGCFIYLEEEGW